MRCATPTVRSAGAATEGASTSVESSSAATNVAAAAHAPSGVTTAAMLRERWGREIHECRKCD